MNLVIDPETLKKVLLDAAEAILNQLEKAEMPDGGVNQNYLKEEMTFKQLLRVTKRSMGTLGREHNDDSRK